MNNYAKSEWLHLIDEWVIGKNSKRNKGIIKDSIINGLSLKELSNKYKLSETRMKTVIRTFKRTLEAHGL